MIFIETDDPSLLLRTAEELGINPKTVKPATVHGFLVDERIHDAIVARDHAKPVQEVQAKRRGRPPKKPVEAGATSIQQNTTEVHDG